MLRPGPPTALASKRWRGVQAWAAAVRPLLRGLHLLPLLATVACPRDYRLDLTNSSTDTPAPAEDSFCSGDDTVLACGAMLRTQVDPSATASFARLTPHERERLDSLIRLPDMEYSVLTLGPRLLLELPASHPAGALQILRPFLDENSYSHGIPSDPRFRRGYSFVRAYRRNDGYYLVLYERRAAPGGR